MHSIACAPCLLLILLHMSFSPAAAEHRPVLLLLPGSQINAIASRPA